jgi:hypothetical protein
MNNETAKQKAIREAYGNHWEVVKDFILNDGWCSRRKRIEFTQIAKDIEIDYEVVTPYHWRPASLQGLESNNGWVLSEEMPDNFSGMVWAKSGDIIEIMDVVNGHFYAPEIGREYTHYQRITKPEPPIY